MIERVNYIEKIIICIRNNNKTVWKNEELRKGTIYLRQEETFYDTLTVKEHLNFSSRLLGFPPSHFTEEN